MPDMADSASVNVANKVDTKITSNGGESGTRTVSEGRLHDPNVTFEEYYYYAKVSRAHPSEAPDAPSTAPRSGLSKYIPFRKGSVGVENSAVTDEKNEHGSPTWHNVSEEEFVQASRALRTATWGAVFYLITTDILGPYSTAYVWCAFSLVLRY